MSAVVTGTLVSGGLSSSASVILAYLTALAIEAAPEIVEAPCLLSATDYPVPREFFGQL